MICMLCYNNVYITDEYKLLEYNDVNGNYVDTVFYGINDGFIFPNNEKIFMMMYWYSLRV